MVAAEGDSTVAWREGSTLRAEVTMVIRADIPTAVIMAAATTVGVVARGGTAASDGTGASTAGAADIGAIHATVGDGVLALAGRTGLGDGDTRMAIATATARGITLPIRIIVVPDIHVLSTGTMTLRLRIRAQNLGATHQSLGHHQPAHQTKTARLATS